MAYLGNTNAVGDFSKLDDISGSFNGITTVFTMNVGGVPKVGGSATNILISVNGIIQEPYIAYNINSTQITFTEAPATGSTFFGVVFGHVYDIGLVSDGTITNSNIVDGAITTSKVVDGAITTSKIAPGAITSDKVANGKLYFFGAS